MSGQGEVLVVLRGSFFMLSFKRAALGNRGICELRRTDLKTWFYVWQAQPFCQTGLPLFLPPFFLNSHSF